MASAATVDGRSARAVRTGSFAVCEQLLAEGVRYVFGNPRTVGQVSSTYLPAIRPCGLSARPRRQWLSASRAVTRATHEPAVVELHSSVGLGNGVGTWYQAKRD